MTPNESRANRRDQNAWVGSASTILLLRGTAQRRNAGYMRYAQANAMTVPSTPPNPSSRSGFAWTINKLAKPNDAHTIDQNDGGRVMRHASAARSGVSLPVERVQPTAALGFADRARLDGHLGTAVSQAAVEALQTSFRLLSDTRTLIRKVIRGLPPAQQQAIDLAFFKGMSQREIAAKTNTPLGTVKTRLELGLKKIYDGLKELKDEL